MSCAQMVKELGVLLHWPWNTTAKCYTTDGANACHYAVLAQDSAPNTAILDWVSDNFNIQNPNLLGHRRWVLGADLGNIAFGMDSNYFAMYVLNTQSYTTARGKHFFFKFITFLYFLVFIYSYISVI